MSLSTTGTPTWPRNANAIDPALPKSSDANAPLPSAENATSSADTFGSRFFPVFTRDGSSGTYLPSTFARVGESERSTLTVPSGFANTVSVAVRAAVTSTGFFD